MDRPLPVTLVAGFFGAGKTSLLHHFLSEHASGPVALLVESGDGIDARALRGLRGAMRRMEDIVLEIPGGDEPTWLVTKFRELAEHGRVRHVLIEVAPTSDPARFVRMIQGSGAAVHIRHIMTVVDAFDYHRTVVRPGTGGGYADLISLAVGCATLLVLNKCDLLAEAQRDECLGFLHQQNTQRRIVETAYGELEADLWEDGGDDEPAKFSAKEPTPASESVVEVGLSSTLYHVHRPFHPARFWAWFEDDHPGLLRVKGLIWLATRNLLVGGISRTRWQNSCGGAGIWWDALPREEWPTDPDALQLMQQIWREPYGDRRQEFVMVGEAYTLPASTKQLGACLLNDEELARPAHEWVTLPDPFPVWDVGEGS